jgi:hypothetical protein
LCFDGSWTFAVNVIAAFFTAVAARASGLFHLGTYNCYELWDSFPPATHLRMSAMNDFTIAACVVAVAGSVMQYKIRPTWFEKVLATLLWAGLVGWFTLA